METANAARADMSSSTSIHTHIDIIGLKYIFWKQSGIIRRIIWVILLIAVSGLFAYNIYTDVMHYLEYPVETSVEVHTMNTLPLPRITICNYNKIQMSSLPAGTSEADYADIRAVYLSDVNNGVITSGQFDQFYINHAQSASQMVIKCNIAGKECSAANLTMMLTDAGVCYAFNAGLDDLMSVSGTHRTYGLRLMLNVQTNEYTKFGSPMMEGFQVAVDNPDDGPLVTDKGVSVGGGLVTDIAITRKQSKRLEAPYGICVPKESTIDMYVPGSCMASAKAQAVKEQCGCRPFYVKDPNTPICMAEPVREICMKETLYDRLMQATPDCPTACHEVTYTTYVTQGKLSMTYFKEMADTNGHTEDYWADNAVVLNVYYNSLTSEVVEQTAAISMNKMLKDIGLNLCLYFGTSILVFFEIIDYILVLICSCGKKYGKSLHNHI